MEQTTPTLVRETKRRIRVDFEGKLGFKERMKLKLTSSSFWVDKVWYLVRFLILLGISYVILSPFFTRIFQSFMAREDFTDMTVSLIPKHFSTDIYKYLVKENGYFTAMWNTLLLSLITAVLQTIVCCMIGYGVSKFKFKGRKLILLLVIITMVVPPRTLQLAFEQHFTDFDIAKIISWNYTGLIELIFGKTPNLTGSFWPFVILSLIGCGFKNGLYIFMMIQFFKGVPDELEESAYVDGSGPFRTFWQIIIPLSIPMMVTIFLFAFSWQWTDEFYTGMFIPSVATDKILVMSDVYKTIPKSLASNAAGHQLYDSAIQNTAGMMIIAPLIVVYLFGQKHLVQGIERTGLVG